MTTFGRRGDDGERDRGRPRCGPCASAIETGSEKLPAADGGRTPGTRRRRSPAVTSPSMPASLNACAALPPIAARFAVTVIPVLAGLVAGDDRHGQQRRSARRQSPPEWPGRRRRAPRRSRRSCAEPERRRRNPRGCCRCRSRRLAGAAPRWCWTARASGLVSEQFAAPKPTRSASAPPLGQAPVSGRAGADQRHLARRRAHRESCRSRRASAAASCRPLPTASCTR